MAALVAKSKIDALLESLSGLKAKAFVAESKTAAALKEFGLEKPEYEVGLSLPTANQEIIFSLHKDGDNLYATTSQSTKIITFEGTLLADLDRKVEELREKKVADFYSWDANRIVLKRNGSEIAAVKEKSGDAEKWLLDPAQKKKPTGPRSKTSSARSRAWRPPLSSTIPVPRRIRSRRAGRRTPDQDEGLPRQRKETVLLVGREDAEKKLALVKSPGLDYLFRVDSGFLQDLPKDKKDWKVEPPKAEESKSDKK